MATAQSTLKTNSKFETLSWRFMRISGLLIVPLVFGHLAIVHLINSVAIIDGQWVLETRWAFLGWRIYDAGLLWFAGLHGYNGLRIVINDYIHNATLNRILSIATAVILVVVLAAGSIALIAAPTP